MNLFKMLTTDVKFVIYIKNKIFCRKNDKTEKITTLIIIQLKDAFRILAKGVRDCSSNVDPMFVCLFVY